MGQPIFEENGQDSFRGIDIMRAVRCSTSACPAGHMYLGGGKTQAGAQPDVRRAARLGVDLRDEEARDRVARLEGLLEELEKPRPGRPRAGTELVQAVVELYGAGLERIVSQLAEREDAPELADALAGDELISHLLLLHDLHPVPRSTREGARWTRSAPTSSRTGATWSWSLSTTAGAAAHGGSCGGCPSSTATLKLAIEDAIHKAARMWPIEAEGVVEERPALLQIEDVRPKRDWAEVARPELASGESLLEQVDGEPVLFLKLAKSLYAYRPDCLLPRVARGRGGGGGRGGLPGLRTRYDVRRAGRSLDGSALQLAPVPLLDDGNGAMKVALA